MKIKDNGFAAEFDNVGDIAVNLNAEPGMLEIRQGTDTVWIPLSDSIAFTEALLSWLGGAMGRLESRE